MLLLVHPAVVCKQKDPAKKVPTQNFGVRTGQVAPVPMRFGSVGLQFNIGRRDTRVFTAEKVVRDLSAQGSHGTEREQKDLPTIKAETDAE